MIATETTTETLTIGAWTFIVTTETELYMDMPASMWAPAEYSPADWSTVTVSIDDGPENDSTMDDIEYMTFDSVDAVRALVMERGH